MAETDTERLVVSLEARIVQFEKAFARANKSANDNWTQIERRGKQAASRLQADMAKAAKNVGTSLSSIGSSIAGNLGVGGALGLSGFLALAVKVNGELAKIPGLAREAGVSTDKLQEVKFAANVKGLGDDEFIAGMRTSLGLLDEAQRNVNTLSRLFNANQLSIRDGNGELLKFDGLLEQAARLMQNARTEQERIKIAEMLGLSREWVRVLRDGPEEFRRLQQEAHNAGAVIDAETVQRAKDFDRKWQEVIVRFKSGMTSALTELASAFGRFWDELSEGAPAFITNALDKLAGGLKGMTLPELQDALKRSVEQGVGQIEVDRIQAEIDRRLGNEPLKIKVNPEVDTGTPTVVPKEKQDNPFNSAVFEAQKRIAATEAETRSIGLNSEARERAQLVAHLQEAAIKANTDAGYQNVTVTEAQRQKINELADSMEAAAKRQREAQESFKAINESLQFGGGLAVDVFDKLISGAATFTDVMKDVEKAILRAVIQAVLLGSGPLGALMGMASPVAGGTGGLIGALFGGMRAEGGPVSAGRAYVVGEKRPELFVPSMSGSIIPKIMSGQGGNPSVTVRNNVHNYAGVQVQQETSPDGMTTDTIITPLDNALGQRIAHGRGTTAKAIAAKARNQHLRG